MSDRFDRVARVQVGDTVVDGLRCNFRIERSWHAIPNSLTLKVYNLTDDARRRLEADARQRARSLPRLAGLLRPRALVFVQIDAGYRDNVYTLFRGDLQRYKHFVDGGTDHVTQIFALAGGVNREQARVNASFPRGVSVERVLRHLAEVLEVDVGDAVRVLRNARFGANVNRYSLGTTLSGNAAHELDKLAASAGFHWSIVDNALHFESIGGRPGRRQAAVLLSPETGLVGSPTREGYFVVKGRCLLQPGVEPGRTVRVESKYVNSTIRLWKTTTQCDTHTNDWFIDFEGAPPRPLQQTRVLPP